MLTFASGPPIANGDNYDSGVIDFNGMSKFLGLFLCKDVRGSRTLFIFIHIFYVVSEFFAHGCCELY